MQRTNPITSAPIFTPGGAFDLVQVLRKDQDFYLTLERGQSLIFRQREELTWYGLIDYLFLDLINAVAPLADTAFTADMLDQVQRRMLPLWEERFFEQWASRWPEQARYQWDTLVAKLGDDTPSPQPWTLRVQREIRADIRRRIEIMFETNKDEWLGGGDFFIRATRSLTRRKRVIATLEVSSMLGTAQDWAAHAVGIDRLDKIWITQDDEWVRDSHTAQHLMRIPADETFPNQCRFPGDPDAPISETAACRCLGVYLPKEN